MRLLAEGEQLTVYSEQADKIVNIQPLHSAESNGFHREIQKFLDAINGKCPPSATLEQGAKLMQLIDAIYLSAECGAEVKL